LITSTRLHDVTEWVDVIVAPWTHIQGVLDLAEMLVILIGVFFGGFSLSLQANAGLAPQLGHIHFLPNPLQFIIIII
jgi:hypothetical protein